MQPGEMSQYPSADEEAEEGAFLGTDGPEDDDGEADEDSPPAAVGEDH